MTEKHSFGNFVPKNTRYLILGSFPVKKDNRGDWFYGSKRNQFWQLLEKVYKEKLKNKEEKQRLFAKLGIAIIDIILECERDKNCNSDTNLKNITVNKEAIFEILLKYKIEKIFFTSRFVEKLFKRHFNDLVLKYSKTQLVTLPSPSPRYALLNFDEKLRIYKKLLPKR